MSGFQLVSSKVAQEISAALHSPTLGKQVIIMILFNRKLSSSGNRMGVNSFSGWLSYVMLLCLAVWPVPEGGSIRRPPNVCEIITQPPALATQQATWQGGDGPPKTSSNKSWAFYELGSVSSCYTLWGLILIDCPKQTIWRLPTGQWRMQPAPLSCDF